MYQNLQDNNSAEPSLTVTGLNKSYGNHQVLHDLELCVEAGSIHGLVGLNGSGKTTTLECILGLQSYDEGNISLLGFAPTQLYQGCGRIVGIFDTPSLHPNLSVRQSLQHARLLCKHPVRETTEVEELLGIGKYSDFKIRQLSLGNKRRASIAQALLGNPELILLDEPFNGLDAGGVEDVLALISSLNKSEGTTFLLSSHQLPYLEQVCSHIAILHGGQIAVSDSVASLFEQKSSRVSLRVDDVAAAQKVIDKLDFAQPVAGVARDSDVRGWRGDVVNVELTDDRSAELNRHLVEAGVEVMELRVQQASLSSLFRQITENAKDGVQ